jgi:Arc/MetJ-type ribon-helix-helix transcriptional regulator
MTKKDKYGYNYIQFTATKEFKERIEHYRDECGFRTNSDFIRAAIREKIHRFENPTAMQAANTNINPALIEKITKSAQKTVELQELTLKRLSIFNEMRDILDLIKKYSIEDLTDEAEKIKNLLRAHKQLNIKQLAEKSNLGEKLIIEIISINNDIELDMKSGRFRLNE